MILILCIDDKRGMMFGSRRQSRDGVLIQRVLDLVGDRTLFVSPYSAALFPEGAPLSVVPDPGDAAGEGDFVFLEDTPLPSEGIEEVILYRWNRLYPATKFFTLSLEGFVRTEETFFPGSSHEKITEERYVK